MKAGCELAISHRSPPRLRLHWWQWGQLLGAIGLAGLAIVLAAGREPHPALVAIVLHVAMDFTFQSTETAVRKPEGGRHLVCHGLVAGGLPLAVAGLVAGDPATTLVWIVAGCASHTLVDRTGKFGLQHVGLAACFDQLCHLGTILALTLW